MSKVRFPGRPYSRAKKLIAKYGGENYHGLSVKSKSLKEYGQTDLEINLKRGCRRFCELFGSSSDEDDEFCGFTTNDISEANDAVSHSLSTLATNFNELKSRDNGKPSAIKTRYSVSGVRKTYDVMIRQGLHVTKRLRKNKDKVKSVENHHKIKTVCDKYSLSSQRQILAKKLIDRAKHKKRLPAKTDELQSFGKTGKRVKNSHLPTFKSVFETGTSTVLSSKKSTKKEMFGLSNKKQIRKVAERLPKFQTSVRNYKFGSGHLRKSSVSPFKESSNSRLASPKRAVRKVMLPAISSISSRRIVPPRRFTDDSAVKILVKSKMKVSDKSNLETEDYLQRQKSGLLEQPLILQGKRPWKPSLKVQMKMSDMSYGSKTLSRNNDDQSTSATTSSTSSKELIKKDISKYADRMLNKTDECQICDNNHDVKVPSKSNSVSNKSLIKPAKLKFKSTSERKSEKEAKTEINTHKQVEKVNAKVAAKIERLLKSQWDNRLREPGRKPWQSCSFKGDMYMWSAKKSRIVSCRLAQDKKQSVQSNIKNVVQQRAKTRHRTKNILRKAKLHLNKRTLQKLRKPDDMINIINEDATESSQPINASASVNSPVINAPTKSSASTMSLKSPGTALQSLASEVKSSVTTQLLLPKNKPTVDNLQINRSEIKTDVSSCFGTLPVTTLGDMASAATSDVKSSIATPLHTVFKSDSTVEETSIPVINEDDSVVAVQDKFDVNKDERVSTENLKDVSKRDIDDSVSNHSETFRSKSLVNRCVICHHLKRLSQLNSQFSCKNCQKFFNSFVAAPTQLFCDKNGKCKLYYRDGVQLCKACWLKSCFTNLTLNPSQLELASKFEPKTKRKQNLSTKTSSAEKCEQVVSFSSFIKQHNQEQTVKQETESQISEPNSSKLVSDKKKDVVSDSKTENDEKKKDNKLLTKKITKSSYKKKSIAIRGSKDDSLSTVPFNKKSKAFRRSGPRVKHVCRRASAVLGLSPATFPLPPELLNVDRMLKSPQDESLCTPSLLSSSFEADYLSPKSTPTRGLELNSDVSECSPVVNKKKNHRLKIEKSVVKSRRRRRCLKCKGCLTEECGKCLFCSDMVRYGGLGIRKKCCVNRICSNPLAAMDDSIKIRRKKLQKNFDTPHHKEDINTVKDNRRTSDVDSTSLTVKPEEAKNSSTPNDGGAELLLEASVSTLNMDLEKFESTSTANESHVDEKSTTRNQQKVQASLDSSQKSKSTTDVTFEAAKAKKGSVKGEGDSSKYLAVNYWEKYNRKKVWKTGYAAIISTGSTALKLCYLCGSRGLEKMLDCTICNELFHTYCLDKGNLPLKMQTRNWRCKNCQYCEICGFGQNLIRCTNCFLSYHMECLRPYHNVMQFKDSWLCLKCIKCKNCGSTSPGPSAEDKWKDGMKLCTPCSRLKTKGAVCSVCKKYDKKSSPKIIQCFNCNVFVHHQCDKMDISVDMFRIMRHYPESEKYLCLECNDVSIDDKLQSLRLYLNKKLCAILLNIAVLLHKNNKNDGCSTFYDVNTSVESPNDMLSSVCLIEETLESLVNQTLHPVVSQSKENQILSGDGNSVKSVLGDDYANNNTIESPSNDNFISQDKSASSANRIESEKNGRISLDAIRMKILKMEYSDVDDFLIDLRSFLKSCCHLSLLTSEDSLIAEELNEAFPWIPKSIIISTDENDSERTVSTYSDDERDTDLTQISDHNYSQLLNNLNTGVVDLQISATEHDRELEKSTTDKKVNDCRRCELCMLLGDDLSSKCGRLIYTGHNNWVHVNCALWSAEVYEDENGSLQNVLKAIRRGKQMICNKCNRYGATVGCCCSMCQYTYHVMCARQDKAKFLIDKKMFCKYHHELAPPEIKQTKQFRADRFIFVDLSPDNVVNTKRTSKGLLKNLAKITIGSTVIDCLGYLTSCSNSGGILIPVDFKCKKMFWSIKEPSKQVQYTLRTVEIKCDNAVGQSKSTNSKTKPQSKTNYDLQTTNNQSLTKASKFRRIKNCDSSDGSEIEQSISKDTFSDSVKTTTRDETSNGSEKELVQGVTIVSRTSTAIIDCTGNLTNIDDINEKKTLNDVVSVDQNAQVETSKIVDPNDNCDIVAEIGHDQSSVSCETSVSSISKVPALRETFVETCQPSQDDSKEICSEQKDNFSAFNENRICDSMQNDKPGCDNCGKNNVLIEKNIFETILVKKNTNNECQAPLSDNKISAVSYGNESNSVASDKIVDNELESSSGDAKKSVDSAAVEAKYYSELIPGGTFDGIDMPLKLINVSMRDLRDVSVILHRCKIPESRAKHCKVANVNLKQCSIRLSRCPSPYDDYYAHINKQRIMCKVLKSRCPSPLDGSDLKSCEQPRLKLRRNSEGQCGIGYLRDKNDVSALNLTSTSVLNEDVVNGWKWKRRKQVFDTKQECGFDCTPTLANDDKVLTDVDKCDQNSGNNVTKYDCIYCKRKFDSKLSSVDHMKSHAPCLENKCLNLNCRNESSEDSISDAVSKLSDHTNSPDGSKSKENDSLISVSDSTHVVTQPISSQSMLPSNDKVVISDNCYIKQTATSISDKKIVSTNLPSVSIRTSKLNTYGKSEDSMLYPSMSKTSATNERLFDKLKQEVARKNEKTCGQKSNHSPSINNHAKCEQIVSSKCFDNVSSQSLGNFGANVATCQPSVMIKVSKVTIPSILSHSHNKNPSLQVAIRPAAATLPSVAVQVPCASVQVPCVSQAQPSTFMATNRVSSKQCGIQQRNIRPKVNPVACLQPVMPAYPVIAPLVNPLPQVMYAGSIVLPNSSTIGPSFVNGVIATQSPNVVISPSANRLQISPTQQRIIQTPLLMNQQTLTSSVTTIPIVNNIANFITNSSSMFQRQTQSSINYSVVAQAAVQSQSQFHAIQPCARLGGVKLPCSQICAASMQGNPVSVTSPTNRIIDKSMKTVISIQMDQLSGSSDRNLKCSVEKLVKDQSQVNSVIDQIKSLPCMTELLEKNCQSNSNCRCGNKSHVDCNCKNVNQNPTILQKSVICQNSNLRDYSQPSKATDGDSSETVDAIKVTPTSSDSKNSSKLSPNRSKSTKEKKNDSRELSGAGCENKESSMLTPPDAYVIPMMPSFGDQLCEDERESLLVEDYYRKSKKRQLLAMESGYVDNVLEDLKPSQTHIEFILQSNEGFFVQSPSLNAAWNELVEEIYDARARAKMKGIIINADGKKMFGLKNNFVTYILEQLNGVEKCKNYQMKFHKLPLKTNLKKRKTVLTTKDDQEEPEIALVENPSGSARTEKFVTRREFDMFNFLASEHRPRPIYNSHDGDNGTNNNLMFKSSRRATSLDLPMAMRFRHLRTNAKEAIGVYRSFIHGRGLFCKRYIESGEMIIEYAGEVIRSIMTDKREKYYESKGIGCYMFRIDDYEVVDATMHGNAARFINHSCEPNCYSKVISIDGSKHIIIFAARKICRGEELTYNYKFPIEDIKIPCTCGAKKCRKYLN